MAKSKGLPPHAVRVPTFAELEQYVGAFAQGHLNLLMIFGREILTETGQSKIVDQHREFIAALLAGNDAALPATVERHIMRLRRPLR